MNEGSLCVHSLVAGEMAWSVCVVEKGDSNASVMQLQSSSASLILELSVLHCVCSGIPN